MLTVLWQTKTMISFPLEDKHVVNEHHTVRKSHTRHTRKMSSRGVFFMYHVIDLKQTRGHQKRCSEGGKKIRGCRGLLGRVIKCKYLLVVFRYANRYLHAH